MGKQETHGRTGADLIHDLFQGIRLSYAEVIFSLLPGSLLIYAGSHLHSAYWHDRFIVGGIVLFFGGTLQIWHRLRKKVEEASVAAAPPTLPEKGRFPDAGFIIKEFHANYWNDVFRTPPGAVTRRGSVPLARAKWDHFVRLGEFLSALDEIATGQRQVEGIAEFTQCVYDEKTNDFLERVHFVFGVGKLPWGLRIRIEPETPPEKREGILNRLISDISNIKGVEPFDQ